MEPEREGGDKGTFPSQHNPINCVRTKAYNEASGRTNLTGMKQTAKLVIAIAATEVGLGLFLLPVVPISVASVVTLECSTPSGPVSCTSYYTLQGPTSASVMYAYFGAGAVQIPGSNGHSYCFVYGSPGTMCGFAMKRMG